MFKISAKDILKRVTRILVILLIISAIETIKSFQVKRDFICLCENGFSPIISKIVFYEKNSLCGAGAKETRIIDGLYKENTSVNIKLSI